MQQGIHLVVMPDFVLVHVLLQDESGQQWKRKEFDFEDVSEVGEIVKQVSSPDYDFNTWANTLSPYDNSLNFDGLTIGQPLTPEQIAEQNQRFDEEIKSKISMVMGLLQPAIDQHQKTQYVAAALGGLLSKGSLNFNSAAKKQIVELANEYANELMRLEK